jgi:hypothetical protein
MKTYRIMKVQKMGLYFFFLLCLLGPFFAKFSTRYPNEDRYYPLWATDLFSNFKRVSTSYSIKLHRLENKTFDSPTPYFEVIPTVDLESYTPHIAIDGMGYSFEKKDSEEFQRFQKNFEKHSLGIYQSAEYSLYEIKYQPTERYLRGEIIEETELVRNEYKKEP